MLVNYERNTPVITIYTSPGCASCRKAKQWLKEKGIAFKEKNIFSTLLNENEIRDLLIRSENGTDDIISKRSKIIQSDQIDVDEMNLNALIHFIQQNPSVLRRPIIISDTNLVVGYDAEEIDVLLPRELRRVSDDSCNRKCPSFTVCGGLEEEAN